MYCKVFSLWDGLSKNQLKRKRGYGRFRIDTEKLAKILFLRLINTKSGEGITAKVDFDVSSKIKSRLSDSTDQWVLKKSGYFENKGRNGIRILEKNIF